MTEENYVFLTKALEKIGFERALNSMLLTEMKLGRPEFSFQMQKPGKDESMIFDINFKKSENVDRYYIKDIATKLSRTGEDDVEHRFQLYKSQGYDMREMKNMLEGRSVYAEFTKDDRFIQLWRQIDFLAKDENNNNVVRAFYNNENKFDLEAAIGKVPFSEKLSASDVDRLMNALKRGDKVPTVIRKNGNLESMFLIAAPDVRAVHILDKNGERVDISQNQLRIIGKDGKPLVSETTEQVVNASQKENTAQTQGRAHRKAS